MWWLMFFSALSSATLLPGSSEVLIVSLAVREPEMAPALLVSATLGNTIGGYITFFMGWGAVVLGRRYTGWLPSEKEQARAMPWLKRYGWWSLLLSWTPVIGDALCLLAGAAKLPIIKSGLAMLVGKALRYAVLLYVAGFLGG